MSFYRDASIERKLTFVMLTTSLLGLSVACVGFEIYERSSYREAIGSELTALADTLGANYHRFAGLQRPPIRDGYSESAQRREAHRVRLFVRQAREILRRL
jgi:hypothetical protein